MNNHLLFSDASSKPLLILDPPSPIHAGEEVTVSCESQGGNPTPILSLYLGSDLLAINNDQGSLATFVASPEHHGMTIACQAINSVMDSPVETSQLLEVLCKFNLPSVQKAKRAKLFCMWFKEGKKRTERGGGDDRIKFFPDFAAQITLTTP
jgi:Immunoglobulin domain